MCDRRCPSSGLDGRGAIARQEWLELEIEQVLGSFHPVDVSSITSGLDVPGSDLDIVCDLRPGGYLETVRRAYGDLPDFRTWVSGPRTMVSFTGRRVGVELSAEPQAVELQQAYRHALVARRAVGLGGIELAEGVRRLRRVDGSKTEPALAKVLGLPGDPYLAIDGLADVDDATLRRITKKALQRLRPESG